VQKLGIKILKKILLGMGIMQFDSITVNIAFGLSLKHFETTSFKDKVDFGVSL